MKASILPPVQVKILKILMAKPDQSFYVNELIRETREYPNAIQFSLVKLEKLDILKSQRLNRKKFYRLNTKNPILDEVKEIVLDRDGKHFGVEKDRWIKLLNRDSSLAFQAEVPLVNRDILPKVLGYKINNFWYNGVTFGVYYKEEELKGLAEIIEKKLDKDREFARANIEGCKRLGDLLLEASAVPDKKNLRKLSNKGLLNILQKYRKAYLDFLPYLVYPHSIERVFITRIEDQLREHLRLRGSEDQYNQVLEVLTAPSILEVEEQVDLLKAAVEVKKTGWGRKSRKIIEVLCRKYAWQPLWTISARPLTIIYFKDAVAALVDSNRNLLQEIRKIEAEREIRKKTLAVTLNKIKAPKRLRALVGITQAYMFLRTYRKNVISQAHHQHLPLIHEVGARLGIGKDVDLVTYEEMTEFLAGNGRVSGLVLTKRRAGWGILAIDGVTNIVSGLEAVLEVMEQFQIGDTPLPRTALRTITGRPACQGTARGPVKIIRNINEISKVSEGDILVTPMTTPDFVPVLRKVAAIVTDEGGVTCHAAIVSREFGIPCIVATMEATKILRTGDEVEVDATNGIIHILDSGGTEFTGDKIGGLPLYKGKVEGKIVTINSEEDLQKVNQESILVAKSITPRFLSALYKARGLIVEEQSPTSHASLYAKTLKIPALGGVKDALKSIKSGSTVELNANNGYVRIF